jgi:hypothetical protein
MTTKVVLEKTLKVILHIEKKNKHNHEITRKYKSQ